MPQSLFCDTSGGEPGELSMEERRENEALKITDLICWSAWLSGRLGWRDPKGCLLWLGA